MPYVSLLVLGALSLVATTLVQRDVHPYHWPIVALAMIGKFCVTGNCEIILGAAIITLGFILVFHL